MKQFYIYLTLLIMVQATSYDALKNCACSSYTKSEVCSYIGYCSWINGKCVDFQCSATPTSMCDGTLTTVFKCSWNSATSTCQDKNYTCNDFTSTNCHLLNGFDCVWSTDTSKCVDFTCKGIDYSHCDAYRCSYVNGVCGDPQSVDCSTQTSANCKGTRPGDGTVCSPNDNGECKSYKIVSKSCSDYNDNTLVCQGQCTYDSINKVCKSKSCSDFLIEGQCKYFMRVSDLTFTPCYWDGKSCIEATEENIQSFNYSDCFVYTAGHYMWDFDSQKCQQCSSLSENPKYQTLKGLIDRYSSSMMMNLVFILLMLLD